MNLPVIGIFTPICLHFSFKCTKVKSDKFLYARLIKLSYETENTFYHVRSHCCHIFLRFAINHCRFLCVRFDDILFRLHVPIMTVQQVASVPYINYKQDIILSVFVFST
jgi:hypothetical protein